MDIDRLAVFAAAYLAVVILPGPSVTALIARVLARGPRGSTGYIAGLVTGALVWFTVAAAGLAALATSFAEILIVVRYAGAAYLLYLAWKLWNAAPGALPVADATGEEKGEGRGLFLTGLAINLGNPKAIAFFLALLPSVVSLESLTPLAFAELAAVIAAVGASVLGAYVLFAVRMRRLFASPRALRLVNRGSGVAVAGAAVAVAAR